MKQNKTKVILYEKISIRKNLLFYEINRESWHIPAITVKYCLHISFAGNGYITTQVLREILEELDDNLSSEDLDNMIEEIDVDGSGTVDWDGE